MADNFQITENYLADDRVDALQKVIGKATFSAEHQLPNMAYAVYVCSTIAKGTIKTMTIANAKYAPGVIDVIYYGNTMEVPGFSTTDKDKEWPGLKIFNDNKVHSNGQPIAMVVANTLERAVHAASLVKVAYVKENFTTDFDKARKDEAKLVKPINYKRGDLSNVNAGDTVLEQEYHMPIETHNPMEMHATIAVWDATGKLTVYDKSQGPKAVQSALAKNFGLEEKNVRVITEYVGGAFGSALRSWPNVPAACIAAKMTKRPVKLMVTREQMFTTVGYRPEAWQKIKLTADKSGKLTTITHDAIGNTSTYENFSEGIVNVSQFLYECPNVQTSYKLLPLSVNTPIWMRGPGPATGCFALESALDELAYKLNIDPVELRLINHADVHPITKQAWTTKYLKECYALGKEKIGWANRSKIAGSKKEDGMLVGYGMATGVFGAGKGKATVRGILKVDGSLVLQSAVSDMGPGTTTAMVTLGEELMQLPASAIKFELGDTDLPPGPTQGGSGTTSAIGSAVTAVCDTLKLQLKELAIKNVTGFKGMKVLDVVYKNGNLSLSEDRNAQISIKELLQQSKLGQIEAEEDAGEQSEESKKMAKNSFSAHFVKVHVHPITGVVQVKQVVTVADAGKIISEKTSRSQMLGGVVGGIGMALMEEVEVDHKYGRMMNSNLAGYHVPVNADIPYIDVLYVNKPDLIISPTGAKGIGETALVGVAPAVANAVYNATGKRVRNLPITADKVMG